MSELVSAKNAGKVGGAEKGAREEEEEGREEEKEEGRPATLAASEDGAAAVAGTAGERHSSAHRSGGPLGGDLARARGR